MSLSFTLRAALLGALAFAAPAFADISITDAYARSSGATAKSGAAFFVIHNTGEQADRLIAATSDIAKRVELHTHIDNGEGVMQMREIDGGIEVPAMGTHALRRGADHVMFMGLNATMVQGEIVNLTLTFEQAGEISLSVPVDLNRTPEQAMQMDHSAMDHSSN